MHKTEGHKHLKHQARATTPNKRMTNKKLSQTAPQPRKVRPRSNKAMNVTIVSPPHGSRRTNPATARTRDSVGEQVLLLENRFFRPGGIRVGTLEKMMFRPGLAPDHMSPPPAFRRTTRVTTIPYSKGSAYRAKIGIDKLASSSKTNPDLQTNARKKIISMFGGDPEKISKQMATRRERSKSPRTERSLKVQRKTGGRATKLINGKETRARPKSRHNWARLAIETSAGTITGANSGCSVPNKFLW